MRAQDAGGRVAEAPIVGNAQTDSSPRKPSRVPNGSEMIVTSLKGLLFVSRPDELQKSGVTTIGVNTQRVELLNSSDFGEEISQYLNHPLTFDQLNEITHSVVTYYREHNHPLVDVTVPSQNVQSGSIQVLVTEFRVGTVRTQGNRWFSDRIVSAPLTLQHGDVIDSGQLINQLDAANTNPFRRVNVVYQPSAQPGYTDVVLDTQDRLPLRVFTGFNNSGTPVTGRSRWEMGANWGNALWHDQQLSYQFSSSNDFFSGRSAGPGQPKGASFTGQTLTWSMPVRGRDTLSVFGSYERSIPNIGSAFGLLGKSGQASIRYSLALHRTSLLIHTLQFGYDFKTTNNNLDFGGVGVSRNSNEIDQFPVAYAGNLTDRHGSTSWTTSLVFSPGGMTPGNNNTAFQPGYGQSGRALADARYVYWRSDVNRLTKLPENFVWSFRMTGQTSTANLLYTEQLAGGGVEILRGYDPNSILGDRGIILSNELRTPSLRKSGEAPWGQVQLLSFWDFANLHSVHNTPGLVNNLNASSVGAGLRYNIRSNVTARFDYGWQLQHLPGADGRNQLANIALMLAY